MDAIKERLGMSPVPPPPKPKGLGGFSLPWRGGDDAKGKSKAKAKPPLIGKFKGLQAGLLDKLKDQATAAITGGVSGVLVLLTIYKVISSRESVLAESRKEEQRGIMERKARLAVMRRSLAGPLRSAARDLNVRLQEILLPTPPTGHARHNYFASHYLEDPEESINTTLYRLCRYLFWVEQLQRGIHSDGELAMDDAWQVAVDVRLERVRQALASSDPLVDATKARERLYDVIDAAVARESAKRRAAAAAKAKAKLEKEKLENGDEDPKVITRPSFKATARALSSTAGTLAGSPGAELHRGDGTDGVGNGVGNGVGGAPDGPTNRVGPLAPGVSFSLSESPDEPGLRVGRFPLRLFRDTQTAIAEVFGEETARGRARGGARDAGGGVGRNDGARGAPGSVAAGPSHGSPAATSSSAAGLGEMLYTDFVIRLESALSRTGAANEPWARWMVPLHLQYHRYASLQARRQRQLTPAQGREVLAARVRLHRVSQALDELLAVLRRRLDDPWFLHSMKRLRKEALANASDAHSYQDAVKRAATKDVESVAGAGADGKPRKRGVTKRGAFAAFRTARWWERQKALRHEAVERWAMLRDALPEVRALGAGWWDREQPPASDAFFGIHFREDSAKAAQVAVAVGKWVRARANRAAQVVLDAAAERPVRALAAIAMAGLAGVAKERKKAGKPLRLPRARRRRARAAAAKDPEPQKVNGDVMRDWMAQKTKAFHDFQAQAPATPASPPPPAARTTRREGTYEQIVSSPPPPRAARPAPPPQPPRNKHPPPAPTTPVPPAHPPKPKPDAGTKADAPAAAAVPAAAAPPAHLTSKPAAPTATATPTPTATPAPAPAHPPSPAAAKPTDTPKSDA